MFSALDKFFLARMLAEASGRCDDKVVVTEVNWMLDDPGGYYHRFAPFKGVASRKVYAQTSEDDYADYMLRYFLHALCSGMVERVYWWRLVSRAFGLVDDSDPDQWRPRVAYRMLATLLDRLGDATFVGKAATDEDVHILRFRLPDRTDVVAAFCSAEPRPVELPFTYERVLDATGEERDVLDRLTGRPVYLLGVADR